MRLKKHVYCHHSSEYEIPFFDVDSMEIVWHGHYVKYFEMARCAFLTEIHYTYDVMREKGYIWPIVQLNLKYIKPALFRQKIRVDLALVDYENCIRIDYTLFDAASGQTLTRGSSTQVAVDMQSGEMLLQTPESWRSAVENYRDFHPLIK